MKKYFRTTIGRLRLIAFLEGISLLILILAGIPLKYYFNNPIIVKLIGPIHGVLFIVFIISVLQASVEQEWKFKKITYKVLLACCIPFGTFYIDNKILSKIKK